MRRCGAAEADGKPLDIETAREALTAAVSAARKAHGDAPLVALRAIQTELFIRAESGYSSSGVRSADLTELGGAFLAQAAASGWMAEDRTLLIDQDALACLFGIRWARLTGLVTEHPFAPSLVEWRLYFRTMMAGRRRSSDGRLGDGLDDTRLGPMVAALGKIDPDYPASLAQGILELRRGRAEPAIALFSQHLREHPSGPWALRAKNYLAAAHELLSP